MFLFMFIILSDVYQIFGIFVCDKIIILFCNFVFENNNM